MLNNKELTSIYKIEYPSAVKKNEVSTDQKKMPKIAKRKKQIVQFPKFLINVTTCRKKYAANC